MGGGWVRELGAGLGVWVASWAGWEEVRVRVALGRDARGSAAVLPSRPM